jgi:hypothetical protein
MQPTNATPRDGFTSDQVVALIRDTPALLVSSGVELVNQNLDVIDDLSQFLAGGDVSRQAYAELHGSANLLLEAELDWGVSLLRPYMNLSDGTTTARFNLGAYWTSSPDTSLQSSPTLHAVSCIDIIDGLNDPVGQTYVVDTGVPYLTAVEGVLLARGYTQYLIEPTAIGSLIPSPKVWVLDDNTTWLKIVNELLAGVGYQGIWSDWNGVLRAQAYISPSLRGSEFAYDVSPTTGMMEPDRSVALDFYKVPNRWVFYRTNTTEGVTPVEGNGIYTYTNNAMGPTSVEARNGRVVTKVQGIDAVDQSALIASGQVTIDADRTVAAKLTLSTSPNPLHWHFDRVTVDDPALGLTQDALVTQWTLPLSGAAMSHEWTLL